MAWEPLPVIGPMCFPHCVSLAPGLGSDHAAELKGLHFALSQLSTCSFSRFCSMGIYQVSGINVSFSKQNVRHPNSRLIFKAW
jgi:hypothetical protein